MSTRRQLSGDGCSQFTSTIQIPNLAEETRPLLGTGRPAALRTAPHRRARPGKAPRHGPPPRHHRAHLSIDRSIGGVTGLGQGGCGWGRRPERCPRPFDPTMDFFSFWFGLVVFFPVFDIPPPPPPIWISACVWGEKRSYARAQPRALRRVGKSPLRSPDRGAPRAPARAARTEARAHARTRTHARGHTRALPTEQGARPRSADPTAVTPSVTN